MDDRAATSSMSTCLATFGQSISKDCGRWLFSVVRACCPFRLPTVPAIQACQFWLGPVFARHTSEMQAPLALSHGASHGLVAKVLLTMAAACSHGADTFGAKVTLL